MGARAHTIGMVLAGIGVAVLLAFATVAVQSALPSSEFRQAQVGREKNPGNAMYDLRFFIVATRLGLLVAGAVIGALLVMNGVTLVMLGRLARQVEGRQGP